MNRRFKIVFFALLSLLGVVFLRLYLLQLLYREEYEKVYARKHIVKQDIPPRRGSVYDRNGELLAVSLLSPSIYIDPGLVLPERVREVCRKVADLLDMNGDYLAWKVMRRRSRGGPGSRFLWVARLVGEDVARKIVELRLPGVGILREYKRVYPHGRLAAHVLGIVGVDGKGLEGVELACERWLHGQPGFRYVERFDGGRRVLGKGVPPANGMDVFLTLDVVIQRMLEDALDEIVRKYAPKAVNGVVMDVTTGEVLAMACRPTFDPNDYPAYRSEYRRNRVITDCYEPGSVMKAFTLAAGVGGGKVTLNSTFYCGKGAFRIGRRVLHDHHPYGTLSVLDIIVHSSNIGVAQIGMRCGARMLYSVLRAAGFGNLTGIDLPGEGRGLLRPPSSWNTYSVVSISMGQELAVTPLQLAVGFSSLAAGGVRRKPYVVGKVVSPMGVTVFRRRPVVVERMVPEWVVTEAVTPALVEVVERGTGRRARSCVYRIAGKTGTAQKAREDGGGYYTDRFVSSFVAYAPASEPRLCVCIVVDEVSPGKPYYGGRVAAPYVGRIMEDALKYLGVPSDRGLEVVDAAR